MSARTGTLEASITFAARSVATAERAGYSSATAVADERTRSRVPGKHICRHSHDLEHGACVSDSGEAGAAMGLAERPILSETRLPLV